MSNTCHIWCLLGDPRNLSFFCVNHNGKGTLKLVKYNAKGLAIVIDVLVTGFVSRLVLHIAARCC